MTTGEGIALMSVRKEAEAIFNRHGPIWRGAVAISVGIDFGGSQRDEVAVSSDEVNDFIGRFLGEDLPGIRLAHLDPT
jgi:hypothetical protein